MGQTTDAAQPQASTDAHALLARQEKGFSADCLFQSWPKERQLEAYRALNTIQDSQGSVHPLTLSYDNSGRHLVSTDGNENAECAPQEVASEKRASLPPKPAGPVDRVSRGDRLAEANPYETERLAHPERPAEKIEGLAKMAMGGDERAKLDLRKAVADLFEQPLDFREKVLQKMVDDGTYLANPFNGKPHVVVNKDASGRSSLTFSQNLGFGKQEIPLNQSFEQQVDTAQKNYKNALQQVVGGLGKFDTESTLRAYDILDGAQPTDNLKWFMLARKDQGRQPVDQ